MYIYVYMCIIYVCMFQVMPIFARDLGLSTAEYGVIVSVMGLSRLLANIPAAWAAEKYGRRPLLIGGPAITAIGLNYNKNIFTILIRNCYYSNKNCYYDYYYD